MIDPLGEAAQKIEMLNAQIKYLKTKLRDANKEIARLDAAVEQLKQERDRAHDEHESMGR